jgi:DNA invertase Pin-like site-specific DNA recombinase
MPTIAYVRVSSEKQDVAAQKLAIGEYCKQRNMHVTYWVEVQISSRKDRKQRKLDDLFVELKKDDVLIVSELSRLARSVGEIAFICETLLDKKVRLICIKEGIDLQKNGKDIDIASLTQITMISLFAQIERTIISMRTKEGLRAAKERGAKLGNPKIGITNKGLKEEAQKFAESLRTILEGFAIQGMTERQMVEELNKLGVTARKGGQWTLWQLQKVLNRLGINKKRTRKIVV